MFTVTHGIAGKRPCLALAATGDLDLFAASDLRRALRRQLTPLLDCVVLDLAGIRWANASGLHHLARIKQDLERAGVPLDIVRPSGPVVIMTRRAHLDAALESRVA